jgi:hypothetical protein
MTQERQDGWLEQLIELEKQATPGPWRAVGKGGTCDGGSTKQHPCFVGQITAKGNRPIVQQSTFLGVQGKTPEEAQGNAQLIVALRNAAPALLDVAQKAQALADVMNDGTNLAPWWDARDALREALAKWKAGS